EISEPGDRAAFVSMLRTTLLAYPRTAIVVTSRDAGFRQVAAHLAPVCTQATLSPFDADDILRLTSLWHREVVGDTERVRADAEELARTIAANDRIRRLAVNPLLLTTLLLVKRWVGSLPRRRAILYGKAVEVLLMTWNTEGHDPIPDDEALPQLCYVASTMMLEALQKISRPRLAALLQEARSALPTELGYVGGTVDQFIRRVEERSSLLMMTGLDVEEGRLVEFFEFRHLTFQEYLTAQAMTKGWHPGRQEGDTLVGVLEPHFEDERWREVVPLAAVLGGKETEKLIRGLTAVGGREATLLLAGCLADEAAARPETIQAAIRELVKHGSLVRRSSASLRGKYGEEFRAEAGRAFLSDGFDSADAGDALLAALRWQMPALESGEEPARSAALLSEMLKKPDELSRCEGAMGIGFLNSGGTLEKRAPAVLEALQPAGPFLVAMLEGSLPEAVAACFALQWLVGSRLWSPPGDSDLLGR
ncbi:MAG: hypothetical protein M3O15_04760, partial [Acidobacteriota bacterium]|nr:hypothetical protein [Acidobacteriota bacterium]